MDKICPNKFPENIPPDGKIKVAFIGEAPGRDEEAAGIPFVGKAGQEFDKWINQFFLRSQCFVGNLCQERPPENKLDLWFTDTKNTIPNEKLAYWISVLKEQLEDIKPNLIVALGRHPTYILTGKDGITKQWGSVLPCTLIPGLKVLALPHPSWIRGGGPKRPPLIDLRPIINVWMKRAKEQSKFPEYKPPQRELVIDPSLEEVMHHLDRLMGIEELYFDIETIPNTPIPYEVWLNPSNKLIYTPDILTCLSFADSPNWAISIPFSKSAGQHRWSLSIEKEVWSKISRLFSQEGTLKVAHNLKFDFLQLAGRRIFIAPPYYCTMIAHNRAYIDLSKKRLKRLRLNRLAFCTALYTEEPFYKEDFKDENKSEKWRGADKEFWIYSAKDAVVLPEIKAATWNDLCEQGMGELFKQTMNEFKPLTGMGMQGVKRDKKLLTEEYKYNGIKYEGLKGFVESKVELLQDELDKIAGESLNTKSSPQMKKFLYSKLNLPIQYHKSTGKPTTDETAIAKLQQKSDHPALQLIKEVTRFRTFKQSYIDNDVSLDGRSRTTYNQSRVSTARTSSSDAILGVGKNLQTIPSKPRHGEDDYNHIIKVYKRSFLPDDGKIMWKRDYRQAEAMVVDYLAENLEAIRDYKIGIDKHCKTAAIIFDKDYQDVYDEYKNGNPDWKMRRNSIGKPTRHGYNYKLGERTLSINLAVEGINVPPKECRKYLDALSAADPATIRWHAEVEAKVRQDRVLINALGLRRFFLGIIDDSAIREAIAWDPQSTVGMLLNAALNRMYHESDMLIETDLLLQIHDSIHGQSPKDKLQDHVEEAGRLMEIPLIIKNRELVIPSDLAVGPNWGDLKEV